MDLEENYIPLDFDCYYQNDDFEWEENVKCTSWTATSKSIKAGQADAKDANVAFKATYTLYLEKNATIEFKYRKDSTNNGLYSNGEFKFLINNEKILVDHDYQQTGWKVFKYEMTQGAGKYAFTWIYSKYNLPEQEMNAEIEYIMI